MTDLAKSAELYSLTFTIHWLPPTNTSDSRHWRKRSRIAKTAQELVWIEARKHSPPHPLQSARLTLVRHSSVQPDFDGLVSGFKYVIDALTAKHWIGERGAILVDDDTSVIGQPTYRWQEAPRGKGGLTVTVEEVEPALGVAVTVADREIEGMLD